MLESLFNKVADLKVCNFMKMKLQHRCFLVDIAKFLRTAFFQNTPGGYFCQFDKVTVQYRASANLLCFIKNNVGWSLLKGFVDTVRVCPLNIINRNHSNTFLFTNLQKRKACSKWNMVSRAICSDIRILTSLDRFLSIT